MKITLLNQLKCPIGDDCPAVEHIEFEDGREVYRVTGADPDDPTKEISVDADPATLFGLADLRITDWSAWLRAHRQPQGEILRIQTLTQYGAPSDDADYVRYIAGEREPASKYREPWFLQLEAERAAGQIRRNLHVLDSRDMTDYLRYACEWGYAYNIEHGQECRILDLAEYPSATSLLRSGDFWVIEGQHVVACRYSKAGVPQGLVEVEAAGAQGFIALARMGWDLAQDFSAWWTNHAEHHRRDIAA